MIEHLPYWISMLFLLTVCVAIGAFYYANGRSKKLLILIISWSLLQSLLAYQGFYLDTKAVPPRFALVLLPATILMVYGLLPKQRRLILNKHHLYLGTLLHTVRIPVEITLFYLFVYGMVPELMTFEGRNLDILAGITAPVMCILYFRKQVGNTVMIIWNISCLCLVLFILFSGILSAELPFQQFGFEQPNKAINYFPFVLLPAVVVPLVIYTHLIALIKLSGKNTY